MARNGSGTYSLPTGNPVVTGTTISSTVNNNTMSDIADALTASVAKDGQTVLTGALDFNGNEIILDADGDTSITADTDDQIDIRVGGTDRGSFVSTGFKPASGNGIDFSATSDGAGTATSELFDDYEEGTWTPALGDGTGTATASVALGDYTKVGNRVLINGRLKTSDVSGLSGSVQIDGLPYPAVSNASGIAGTMHTALVSGLSLGTVGGTDLPITGYMTNGNSFITLRVFNGSTATAIDKSDWTDDGEIYFSGQYRA